MQQHFNNKLHHKYTLQRHSSPRGRYQQKVVATSEWCGATTVLQYCDQAVCRCSISVAVAVRSKLLVSDPDHPGIRTLARWPRVRHAATELRACTLQRSSGSWVRRRVLPVLWISALCHVSGYNSSYDMMSLVTSLRRQDSVVFRIVPCSRFLSNS